MRKETIEEAAENYCSNNHAINEDRAAWQDIEFAFKDGAAWQAKRMYSEEDMVKFMQYIVSNQELEHTSSVSKDTAKYYLERFKKQKS